MCRRRGGRGQAFAFDAELITRVEEMKQKIGYYPTLREIGLSFNPPYSHSHVTNRLQVLIAEGRLSADAAAVYKEKSREEKGHEKSVRKTGKTSVKAESKSSGKNAKGKAEK